MYYNCCMEFFIDNSEIQRFPPEQTRPVSIQVEPYPDRRRLHVQLETTPFEKSPHIEITLTDASGNEVGSVSIIEPAAWKMEFTMHIRHSRETDGRYTLTAHLFYPEGGPQAKPLDTSFEIPPAKNAQE